METAKFAKLILKKFKKKYFSGFVSMIETKRIAYYTLKSFKSFKFKHF